MFTLHSFYKRVHKEPGACRYDKVTLGRTTGLCKLKLAHNVETKQYTVWHNMLTVCSDLSLLVYKRYPPITGSLQPPDWTSGLDWWTGPVDWHFNAKNHFCETWLSCRFKLASFPGPARSSLAVRNLHRRPGLIHHVMSATVVFVRHQVMFAVLPIYMYNGVSSWNKSSTYDRL